MKVKLGKGNKANPKASPKSSGSSRHYDGNPINAKAKDADWDEDIDDDLAFNSEDEKLFGHHFKSSAAASPKTTEKKLRKTKESGKKSAKSDFEDDNADTGEMTGIFDRLNPLTGPASTSSAKKTGATSKQPVNDDEIASDVFSDDSRSEIDLEEMLMTKDEQRRQREKRKKKNKRDNDGATKTSKTLGGRAGATETDDFLLRQQEGVLISSDIHDKLQSLSTARAALTATKGKKSAKVNIDLKTGKEKKEADELFDISNAVINPEAEKRQLGRNEMASIKALVDESEAVDKGQTSSRLMSAVNNRKALLTEDIDEYEKTKQDRSQTREIVAKGLKKYDGVLKEQQMAKHLQFPLNVSGADAVPHSLGGMAAAFMNKNAAAATSSSTNGTQSAVPQNSLAAKMQALLESSGLATKKSAPKDGSGAFKEGQEGFVDIRERPDGAEENEGDENEFAMNGRSSDMPDRNYMAMLKAKLGYEIARRTRFNKIKSKTYRRILRKEEEREKQRREQAAEILDPEGARRKRMEKMEKDRALERVTQKHKNTSKWVRHVKGIAKFDDNAKEAIQQQLMQHQRLMAKMDEDAGAEWEAYDEAEKASQAESEEQDRIVDELLNDAGDKPKTSSLFWDNTKNANATEKKDNKDMSFIDKARKELNSMGFMKQAKEREDKEYQTQVEKLKADVARYKRGEALEHVDDEGNDISDSKKHSQVGSGRKRFAAANAVLHTEQSAEDEAMEKLLSTNKGNNKNGGIFDDEEITEKRDDVNEDEDNVKTQDDVSAQAKKVKKLKVKAAPLVASGLSTKSKPTSDADAEASALNEERMALEAKEDGSDFVGLRKSKGLGEASATNNSKKSKRSRTVTTEEDQYHGRDGEDTTATTSTEATTEKQPKKSTGSRITIHPKSMDEIISVQAISPSHATSTAGNTSSSSAAASGDESNGNAHQLQQEYLASRAFAKDDIDEDFLKMKEQQVEAIMKPKDKNATLPGWGEWGGENERLNTRHKAKVE